MEFAAFRPVDTLSAEIVTRRLSGGTVSRHRGPG